MDSYFAFRPPRLHPHRSAAAALGEQLLDVLPHPLYSLVDALMQLASPGDGGAVDVVPKLVHVTAMPTDLHATLRAGEATGRLAISLRARPVASTLTITGAHGSLTAVCTAQSIRPYGVMSKVALAGEFCCLISRGTSRTR